MKHSASSLLLTLALTSTANAQQAIVPRVLGVKEGPIEETLKERFLTGENFQLLLLIPEAANANGPLLDPATVTIAWNDHPLAGFLYYRMPALALGFGLLDPQLLREQPVGEIRISATLLDQTAEPMSMAIPLSFTQDEVSRIDAAQKGRGGRAVRVLDENEKPIEEAFVFGQRRKDLLTHSDAGGHVTLDSPARNSSPAHYAWKAGFWAERFDPLTSGTVTLLPVNDGMTTSTISAPLTSADGSAIPLAIITVNHVEYLTWRQGESLEVAHPAGRDVQLTVLAPGFAPTPITLSEALAAEQIVLDSRAARTEGAAQGDRE